MKLVCNNKEFEFNEGDIIKDILNEEIKEETITCSFNNEIKSLNHKPKTNGKVELLDYRTTEGKRVYVRGIMYIMSMAVDKLYPKADLTINYQLDNSMFCTFENLEITEEILNQIAEEMKQIISEDLPITKVKMTSEEAKAFYEKEKSLRGILQISLETKEVVSLYYCKDYYNYFYGVMPVSTGKMQIFELVKYRNRLPTKIS